MEVYDFLLVLLVLYGVGMFIAYFLFMEQRNLWTQKVLYMNEEIEKYSDVREYRFNQSMPIKLHSKGEKEFPPSIHEKYKANIDYRRITQSIEMEKKLLNKRWTYLTISFIAVTLILILASDFTIAGLINHMDGK